MTQGQPGHQPANAHHLRVGEFVVTTLQDAYLQGSFALVTGIAEDEARRLHEASHRPSPPRITLNAYLVHTGERRILVDAGLGPLAGDEGARLEAGLAACGLGPADIDTILVTHCHPDHVGGLIDADDRPAFPGREIWVPGGELDYWDQPVPDDVNEGRRHQFKAAHRVLGACGGQIRRLDGTDFADGIHRFPLPGHTPDHSGYRLASGGTSLLLAADIVHLPHIQFPRPEATVAFDTDPAGAARTRQDLFAELAASGQMIAGHHIDFPGVGYVVPDGAGYRFLPHVWSPAV